MFNFEISAKILTYLNLKKKYFENACNLIKSLPTLFNNDISNIKATKKNCHNLPWKYNNDPVN